jgi:ParB family chromosome partitioning protein
MPLRNIGKVDVSMVVADPAQPRVEFSDEAIDRLAQSIRQKGQLGAIRVRWSEELGKWVIIAGERRWRAVRRAGLPTIDCYFHEQGLTKSEVLEQQLVENCLREDLRPVEEARAFAALMELNGWTGKQLAEKLSLPPSKVSRALALLKLPPDIQHQVEAGTISARTAYEISKLNDDTSRRHLARMATSGALTHEQAAKAARRRKNTGRQKPRGTKLTFFADGGWRVIVCANRNGTYDEVEQALQDALEEVRHRIANRAQLF